MEEKLREIVHQKIHDTLSKMNEIQDIVESLDKLSSENNAFTYGIVIGRLYNSFYYQCRRILKRNPTDEEFSEFLDILKSKETEILEKLDLVKK